MKLADVVAVLERVAPVALAEEWDNVGLLAGDPSAPVARVLVTVDLTPAVVTEAAEAGADLVVAYHPPLFKAVRRIPADAPWAVATRRGIALYSPHTALDAARGGTNDVLADLCGMDETRRPLRPLGVGATGGAYKVVTFVPEGHVEALSEALFAAGAGRIGAYERCSFRTPGTGTFFGGEGANPTVGAKGRLETVEELRLEVLVARAHLDAAVTALRRAHPYEEPAFDVVPLAKLGDASLGQGRVGRTPRTERRALVARLKERLGVTHVLVAGSLDGEVGRVAVAAGAGGELLADAAAAGAEVFVTGEVRHHDALEAARRGMTILSVLHSNSERVAVRAYADRLREGLEGVDVRYADADADPFVVV